MTTLIEVADKRGLSYINKEGEEYTSKLLKELISTSDGFKYAGKGAGMDLHTLEEEDVFTFLVELDNEIKTHREMCKFKGSRSATLTQLEKLYEYIQEIDEDPYFYWKEFLILAKIDYEDVKPMKL